MSLRRIFRREKHKKSASESLGTPLGGGSQPSPEPDAPTGLLALINQPFISRSSSSLAQHKRKEEWPNLAAFSGLLNQGGVFGPLTEVVDDLRWFTQVHEDLCSRSKQYQAIRTQLEALCGDLREHFSGGTPPSMTTSMCSLCRAIQAELRDVYDTQDRDTISRYMQANQDMGRVTGCYERIRVHLERVKLNASLNTLRIVDQQATDAKLKGLSPSMSACYDSAEANVVQRRECAPRTREQVLEDLTAWKDTQGGEMVCWMNGMVGTGKTTIATTLCSSLDTSHQLGGSFFCTRSLPACRDVKLILPTIAYQLARFSGPFRGELLQVLNRDPDVHTKVPRVQFQRMILEPLRQVARSLPSSVVVVIDALDECDDGSGVGQMLEVLLEHASKLPIKILVSSRPEYHIRQKIRESTLKRQLILHELDEKMVKADIETYLRAELASIVVPPTNSQVAALVERAGALFIYAATVVRYIKDGHTMERLANILEVPKAGQESTNKTSEIDVLYQTVLISAFRDSLEKSEKERMKMVLYTVVCAQEPLTTSALASILCLDTTQVTEAVRPLWSVLHVSESDATHRVSTLHASFPDYMIDSIRSKRFACDPQAHHGKLAELCFQRIERNIPQFNVCQLKSSYAFDNDVPHLDRLVKQSIGLDLLYACQYWATHLSLGGKSNHRAAALHEFLSKRLLLWMEVLNLTKQMNQGIGIINRAISWLAAQESSESTRLLALDGRRFVTMFATSPVSQSTPHVYSSMLVSWPSHRPIAECYSKRAIDPVRIDGLGSTERQLNLLSLAPARSEIKCVTYAPDGTIFVAGTVLGEVLIWDAGSCRMTIDPIRGHNDQVRAVTISPNGTQICSGSQDKTICIWDLRTGQRIAGPLQGHTNWVRSVVYSPDGAWLASGSNDGTVRIWSTDTWQMRGDPLHGPGGRVTSVVFSPDGSILAASSESLICLWDPLHGQMIGNSLKGHTDLVTTLAFMPGGQHLVSGSIDSTVRVWDVSSRQLAFDPLLEHQSHLGCVAVSPDGSLLATASVDDTIRMWDTTTWQTRSIFRQTGIARSVTFSPDGSLLLSGSADGYMRLWEVSHTVERHMMDQKPGGHSHWVKCVAFSPCGSYIVSGSHDKTVCIWDSRTREPIHTPLKEHHHYVISVGFSVDGQHVFSISADRVVCVWETQTGKLEYEIGPVETDGDYDDYYQEDWPVDFLFDGKRVVCGSKSGRIYMWEDAVLSFEMTGHDKSVTSIAFSPDGKSFASGSADGAVMMWDVGSGKRLRDPFAGHPDEVNSIAFSPDGSLVASGSDNDTICVWSTSTGLQVCDPLQGHTRYICCVAFSPDGKHIVSGSRDMSIRVWSVADRGLVEVFHGHLDSVRFVAFSPDGTGLVSGSCDTTIRFWALPVPPSTSTNDGLVAFSKLTKSDTSVIWTMDGDGWVRDEQDQLLLWVPPDLRTVLLWPQNTMLISRQGCIQLDLSGARIGPAWASCFSPFPSVSGE